MDDVHLSRNRVCKIHVTMNPDELSAARNALLEVAVYIGVYLEGREGVNGIGVTGTGIWPLGMGMKSLKIRMGLR